MPTTSLIIDTPDGQCPATLHTQDNHAALPAVIMYPDAGGARPAIREMATTLSGFGYTVLLPDVYYRHGPWQPLDMSAVWTDPVERQRMLTMAKSLTPDIITRDGDAFTDFLIRHPQTVGARVGVCGYCGGGRGAFILAGRLADRIAAVGAIHPGGLVTDGPESPHLLSSQISGAVYIGAAHNDPQFTHRHAEAIEHALSDATIEHEIDFYGAPHGFAVADSTNYHPDAADQHWAALKKLFRKALPAEGPRSSRRLSS